MDDRVVTQRMNFQMYDRTCESANFTPVRANETVESPRTRQRIRRCRRSTPHSAGPPWFAASPRLSAKPISYCTESASRVWNVQPLQMQTGVTHDARQKR